LPATLGPEAIWMAAILKVLRDASVQVEFPAGICFPE